jgi:hypothetical protein
VSRDNAIKFVEEIANNQSLLERVLDGCSSATAWITAAASAGYQCSIDELRSVAEQLVGRPIEAESLVGALRSLFEPQLDEGQLAGVVGGATFPFPQRDLRALTQDLSRRVGSIRGLAESFVKGDIGWSNDPKSFNPMDMVINPVFRL